jgi:hypothetical protein
MLFLGEGHSLVSADEPVAEGEVAFALPPVSDFILQAQKSLNFFEPSGVQTIEVDASQLEMHSALYNLEHSSDVLLEHIFSHSPPPPPVQQQQFLEKKKTEIDRRPLANLFKKKSRPRHFSKSKRNNNRNPSLKMLKKFGLERLAIFQQPRPVRDDLDSTSPAIAPQDDPRSPNLSTLNRVFLSFSSLMPSSDETSSVKRQFKPEGPSGAASNDAQIGLGLPSRVVSRRKLRQQQEMSPSSFSSFSQEIDSAALRYRSRRRSSSSSIDFERPNYSFIVTEPSFGSNNNRVQSVAVESSNQFLKPSQFITERSLYDIVEVPTPPSSTLSFSCSPPTSGGTSTSSSRRNQWSSPFIRLNPPQKRKSFVRTQSSSSSFLSTGSPTTNDDEEVVATTNVDPLSTSGEALAKAATTTTTTSGFKRYISKFRDLLSFKRSSSRSMKKTSDYSSVLSMTSPVPIERPEAELLRQDGGANENRLTLSISAHNLQLLF